MHLGLVGLRTMGRYVAHRALAHDHTVLGFDRDRDAAAAAEDAGISIAASLDELVHGLEPPRALWVAVPPGGATRAVLDALAERLAPGDVVVDAGPSPYQDTRRQATMLHRRSLLFLDAGICLGAAGPDQGLTLLIGGPEQAVERLQPVFDALAPEPAGRWGHVGPNGAGHYARMVHDGIAAGMTQALAEGLTLLQHARDFDFDLHQIASTWQTGSALSAGLLAHALRVLDAASEVDDSVAPGDGSPHERQVVQEALALDVPAPVLTLALMERLRSRRDRSVHDPLQAALHRPPGDPAPSEID